MLRISIKSADFLRKWVNFGTECARFSIKCAGVLKWVFENVRKRSKTFKNIQKLGENIQKLTRNIRKYSNFLHPPAHLIDFSVGHEGTKTQRKIRRRLPKLTQIF